MDRVAFVGCDKVDVEAICAGCDCSVALLLADAEISFKSINFYSENSNIECPFKHSTEKQFQCTKHKIIKCHIVFFLCTEMDIPMKVNELQLITDCQSWCIVIRGRCAGICF